MKDPRAGAAGLMVLLLLAGCSEPGGDHAQGYVEGEFVRVAPEAGGRLAALDVERGQPIAAGASLFALDDRDERAALARAEALQAQAEASLADMKSGRRAEEIRVLDAQLAEAEAALLAAQKAYDRNLTLSDKAVASAAALDQAKADLDAARARVDAAQQNRAVAELPARPDAIRAAEQNVAALAAATQDART
ncbi:MAG: biotin/lipoyl-binding protein, partial [Rhizobiales bacterium]|nr:biotin/lipoyl-binding protein [Hyphomicrobiales bacterium]